jgi:hypothetical protein
MPRRIARQLYPSHPRLVLSFWLLVLYQKGSTRVEHLSSLSRACGRDQDTRQSRPRTSCDRVAVAISVGIRLRLLRDLGTRSHVAH